MTNIDPRLTASGPQPDPLRRLYMPDYDDLPRIAADERFILPGAEQAPPPPKPETLEETRPQPAEIFIHIIPIQRGTYLHPNDVRAGEPLAHVVRADASDESPDSKPRRQRKPSIRAL